MIKKNWKRAVISSLLILLPAVIGLFLWDQLPETMTLHWGADGHADGFGHKAVAVFGLPAILLVLHWLCLLLDNLQKEQNTKVKNIIFWIMPMISIFVSGSVYSLALGRADNAFVLIPLLMGVLFVFIGNYMPKATRNRTFGVKLYWCLANEENWNKTHRLAGKLWVAGGFVMLLTAFLPVGWAISIMAVCFLAMIAVPTVYSYRIYLVHKRQGIKYDAQPRTKAEKIAVRTGMIMMPLILIAVGILMFTGDIDLQVGQYSFKLEATYWSDLAVEYEKIDSIELREDKVSGNRIYGFGSARLSLGNFQNEEFGSYYRYTYTGCRSCIVICAGEQVLVISGKDNTETELWYNQIFAKISE